MRRDESRGFEAPRVHADLEGFATSAQGEAGFAEGWGDAGGLQAGRPPRMTPPAGFDTDRCRLMVRDPRWIHAYWEIGEPSVERAHHDLGEQAWKDHQMILRVHGIPLAEGSGQAPLDHWDLVLEDQVDNRYIQVPQGNRSYRVDVGVLTAAGLFYPLVSSNTVVTPPDGGGGGDDGEERWVDSPDDLRGGQSEDAPSREGSPPEGAAPEPGMSGGGEVGPRQGSPRRSDGMAILQSGAGLPERLPGPEAPPAWEAGAWPSGAGRLELASGAGVSAEGGGAMPMEVPEPRPAIPTPAGKGGFWFNLQTEIVLYGATEPNARVTIQGKPVALRPDGTFTLRFHLPDGQQVLEAIACSADGGSRWIITPTVSQSTTFREVQPVGADA